MISNCLSKNSHLHEQGSQGYKTKKGIQKHSQKDKLIHFGGKKTEKPRAPSQVIDLSE
jgi:hypothetical protein